MSASIAFPGVLRKRAENSCVDEQRSCGCFVRCALVLVLEDGETFGAIDAAMKYGELVMQLLQPNTTGCALCVFDTTTDWTGCVNCITSYGDS